MYFLEGTGLVPLSLTLSPARGSKGTPLNPAKGNAAARGWRQTRKTHKDREGDLRRGWMFTDHPSDFYREDCKHVEMDQKFTWVSSLLAHLPGILMLRGLSIFAELCAALHCR